MLRPPLTLTASNGNKLELLEHEIVREKVATLGRIGARLRTALDALAEHDASGAGDAEAREQLLAAAGEALWFYVIQREVCGLGDSEAVLREWGVPREVRRRMGPRRAEGA